MGGQHTAANFNPRSREGSDRHYQTMRHRHPNFNPRSREGSDHGRLPGTAAADHFNPRSREGSDSSWTMLLKKLSNFNPRSREGSDKGPKLESQRIGISIHAPVKGATYKDKDGKPLPEFQSTLP